MIWGWKCSENKVLLQLKAFDLYRYTHTHKYTHVICQLKTIYVWFHVRCIWIKVDSYRACIVFSHQIGKYKSFYTNYSLGYVLSFRFFFKSASTFLPALLSWNALSSGVLPELGLNKETKIVTNKQATRKTLLVWAVWFIIFFLFSCIPLDLVA